MNKQEAIEAYNKHCYHKAHGNKIRAFLYKALLQLSY